MSGFFVLSSFYTTAYPSDFRAVFPPNSQEEFWEWVEKGDFKILLSIYQFVGGHDFETSEYSARQESHLGITRSLWKKSFMKMWNCTARIKFFWMLTKLLDLGTRCMNLKCLHFLLLTTLFFCNCCIHLFYLWPLFFAFQRLQPVALHFTTKLECCSPKELY